MRRAILATVSVFVMLSSPALAAELADWALRGSVDASAPLPADTIGPNVSSATLSLGAEVAGITVSDGFLVQGFPAGAFDPDKYIQVGVALDTGYGASYDSLTFHLYSLFAGASVDWEVRSSVDGFSAALGSGSVSDLVNPTAVHVDLSSLTEVPTGVSLRIYAFNAAGGPVPAWVGLKGALFQNLGVEVHGTTMFLGPPVDPVADWGLLGTIDSSIPLPADTIDPNVVGTLSLGPGVAGIPVTDGFFAQAFPTGALDLSKYFQVEISPGAGTSLTYDGLNFHLYSLFAGSSADWEIRSSVDGFTSALDSGTASDLSGHWTVDGDLSSLSTRATAVSLRIYVFNAAGGTQPGWVGLKGDMFQGLGVQLFGSVLFDGTDTFNVTGRFVYEDRMWDAQGYTGTTQNLPMRSVDVDLIDLSGPTVIGSATTDDNGDFSIEVTLSGVINLQAQAWSQTGSDFGPRIKVVGGNFVTSFVHSVTSESNVGHDGTSDLDLGTTVVADPDGLGLAQAFNILDMALRARDWYIQPQIEGSPPLPFTIYWGPDEDWRNTNGWGNSPQFYTFVASPLGGDTDGWSDPDLLRGFGGMFLRMSSQRNEGGTPVHTATFDDPYGHPRRAWDAASVIFVGAQIRAFMAANGLDQDVGKFVELTTPPPLPMAGGLEFSYDFEDKLYSDGSPIDTRSQGSQVEVAAVLWDLFDNAATVDATVGVDDDPLAGNDSDTWTALKQLTLVEPVETYTFDTFFQAWRAAHGAGYLEPDFTSVLETVNEMNFLVDAAEPNEDALNATSLPVQTFGHQGPTGTVVINEINPPGPNYVELYNSGDDFVDLAGWKVVSTTSATDSWIRSIFNISSFVLAPGSFVTLWSTNTRYDNATELFSTDFRPGWGIGTYGSCELRNADGVAVDFVRWDGIDGPSTAPVPAGTSFTGNVLGPDDRGESLVRDMAGTDTDDASDWTTEVWSVGQPNGLASLQSTFFDVEDVDVYRCRLEAGEFYSFWASDLLGGAHPRMELLDTDGQTVLLSVDYRIDPRVRPLALALHEAAFTFGAVRSGDYYVRLTQINEFTNYGTYRIRAYQHPVSLGLLPPISASIDAQNSSVVADQVYINWLNGPAYEQVHFTISGPTTLTESVEGSSGRFFTYLSQGVHVVEFQGESPPRFTPIQKEYIYAGPFPYSYTEDFEALQLSNWELEHLWEGTDALAGWGARSLRDNPLGGYQNDLDVSAILHVPVQVGGDATLSFSTICITETGADFGRVEASGDGGQTWDLLAQYDESSYPGWSDGSADPADWEPQVLSLAAYQGSRVKVRFRLITDGANTREGWHVDDVVIDSDTATDVPEATKYVDALGLGHPNPFNPVTTIGYSLAAPYHVELVVFDVRGRRVATLVSGDMPAGNHRVRWYGKDDLGAPVASGVYFYRMTAGAFERTRKLVLAE